MSNRRMSAIRLLRQSLWLEVYRPRPASIRQWASRGYLTAVGRRGRSPLYSPEHLAGAQTGVQDRTRTSPPIRPTVALRSKDLDALLYGAEAAALVAVAPSTIRMWKMRGRLRPVDRPGRLLFRVEDVLRAARRERCPPRAMTQRDRPTGR